MEDIDLVKGRVSFCVIIITYVHILHKYCVVFMSPESAMTRPWRKIFSEPFFKSNLTLLAIDEAHCITEWLVCRDSY